MLIFGGVRMNHLDLLDIMDFRLACCYEYPTKQGLYHCLVFGVHSWESCQDFLVSSHGCLKFSKGWPFFRRQGPKAVNHFLQPISPGELRKFLTSHQQKVEIGKGGTNTWWKTWLKKKTGWQAVGIWEVFFLGPSSEIATKASLLHTSESFLSLRHQLQLEWINPTITAFLLQPSPPCKHASPCEPTISHWLPHPWWLSIHQNTDGTEEWVAATKTPRSQPQSPAGFVGTFLMENRNSWKSMGKTWPFEEMNGWYTSG